MKDQFVIAYLPSMEVADCVITHAQQMAQMLGKDIILLHVDDPRHRHSRVSEDELKHLQETINHSTDTPGRFVPHASYCILHQSTREAIDAAATLMNGVVAVVAVNANAQRKDPTHPHEVLRNFSQSKIAYLTIQVASSQVTDHNSQPINTYYSDISLSIDFKKESKEKLIWASYFARFNRSSIHVFYDDYRDEGLRAKWYNNMKFLTKFFDSLSLTFTPHAVKAGHALFPEVVMLDQAAKSGCSLLVSITTDLRAKDTLEFFVGTQEERTIRNPHHLPVLFINPRDDIYVLCD